MQFVKMEWPQVNINGGQGLPMMHHTHNYE